MIDKNINSRGIHTSKIILLWSVLFIDNSAYWIHYTQQKDNPLQSPPIFLKYYYEINENYGKYS